MLLNITKTNRLTSFHNLLTHSLRVPHAEWNFCYFTFWNDSSCILDIENVCYRKSFMNKLRMIYIRKTSPWIAGVWVPYTSVYKSINLFNNVNHNDVKQFILAIYFQFFHFIVIRANYFVCFNRKQAFLSTKIDGMLCHTTKNIISRMFDIEDKMKLLAKRQNLLMWASNLCLLRRDYQPIITIHSILCLFKMVTRGESNGQWKVAWCYYRSLVRWFYVY